MRNQILSVDNSKKNNRNKVEKIEINKIIRFFVIFLILFSVSCVGIAGYTFANNNNISIIGGKPKLNIEKQNDGLTVITSSKNGIDRIEYSWNSNETKEISGNGQSEVEEKIDLPTGENKSKLIVYDKNGKSTSYEEDYEVEPQAPQLALEGSNGKLKITAKDNEQMAYVTYRWDDGDEKKIEVTESSSAQIEKEIEIPRGQHTITVVAVNKRNLTTEKTQEVKGVVKPLITVVQDSENLKYLILSVTDEEAVKLIEFNLNGKVYEINLSDYKEKQIQYRIEMKEGENEITVKATNFDGATGTFEGACNYAP